MTKKQIIAHEVLMDHKLLVAAAQAQDQAALLGMFLDAMNAATTVVMTEAEAKGATPVLEVDPRVMFRFEMTAEVLTPLERAVRAAEVRAALERQARHEQQIVLPEGVERPEAPEPRSTGGQPLDFVVIDEADHYEATGELLPPGVTHRSELPPHEHESVAGVARHDQCIRAGWICIECGHVHPGNPPGCANCGHTRMVAAYVYPRPAQETEF